MSGLLTYSKAREQLWSTARGRWALVAVALSMLVFGIVARALSSDDLATVLSVGYILSCGTLTRWLAERLGKPRG
ncbi:hypothetical protein BH10ACT8_BH10ACT8_20930 [soil metagenome]|jgi:hypothetical protein